MERGRNIACLKRNGHWFYFRWDDENQAKMLWHAYLQAIDPECAFDPEGFRRLVHEIKDMPESGVTEKLYWNEGQELDPDDYP